MAEIPKTVLPRLLTDKYIRVKQLRGDASNRAFFRLVSKKSTAVAMVYPRPAGREIASIIRLTGVYARAGLRLPRILDQIDDRILLLEDLGDLSLQQAMSKAGPAEKDNFLKQAGLMLERIAAIPTGETTARLDRDRMKTELFFFRDHFLRPQSDGPELAILSGVLEYLASRVPAEKRFAHRDFHSRNLMVKNGRLYLIDFQDSLVAPPDYDLVSLAFDSYLDTGRRRSMLAAADKQWPGAELRYTALQRNIKALGTFAFQARERGNKKFLRYLPRTLGHARGHLAVLDDAHLQPLALKLANIG